MKTNELAPVWRFYKRVDIAVVVWYIGITAKRKPINMLKLRDLVVVKNEKGEMVATKTYDRVYLAYGANDPVVERDVTAGKVKVGTKQEPKDAKSVHEPNELFSAAIAYLQTEKPKSDPLIVLLSEAEYGLDLSARANIRNAIAPSKPVDEDKTVEKAAKALMSLGLFADLGAAKDAVRAQMASKAAPTTEQPTTEQPAA